jgi:hypothetical protein
MNKKLLTAVLVLGVVVLGLVLYFQPAQPVSEEQRAGGILGRVETSPWTFQAGINAGNMTAGKGVATIATTASVTTGSITAAQFCQNGVIQVSATSNTTSTITLPVATSTNALCLSTNGNSRQIFLVNTSSSANTITLASSTGITFLKPFNVSSTFTLAGGSVGVLTVIRDSATSQKVIYERQF